jgi:hypothetical protein
VGSSKKLFLKSFSFFYYFKVLKGFQTFNENKNHQLIILPFGAKAIDFFPPLIEKRGGLITPLFCYC